MKIDPGLLDYIKRNEQAINANPIRAWPSYADNPVLCWRYFARCFGYGLVDFPEEQVLSEVKNLYGRWFVRAEFSHKIPDISNLLFTSWIIAAMQEAKADKDSATPGQGAEAGKGDEMKKVSNVSYEVLGINPSELAGMSVAEIVEMIRLVQNGLAASEPRMSEEEIAEAAEKIYADASF